MFRNWISLRNDLYPLRRTARGMTRRVAMGRRVGGSTGREDVDEAAVDVGSSPSYDEIYFDCDRVLDDQSVRSSVLKSRQSVEWRTHASKFPIPPTLAHIHTIDKVRRRFFRTRHWDNFRPRVAIYTRGGSRLSRNAVWRSALPGPPRGLPVSLVSPPGEIPSTDSPLIKLPRIDVWLARKSCFRVEKRHFVGDSAENHPRLQNIWADILVIRTCAICS